MVLLVVLSGSACWAVVCLIGRVGALVPKTNQGLSFWLKEKVSKENFRGLPLFWRKAAQNFRESHIWFAKNTSLIRRIKKLRRWNSAEMPHFCDQFRWRVWFWTLKRSWCEKRKTSLECFQAGTKFRNHGWEFGTRNFHGKVVIFPSLMRVPTYGFAMFPIGEGWMKILDWGRQPASEVKVRSRSELLEVSYSVFVFRPSPNVLMSFSFTLESEIKKFIFQRQRNMQSTYTFVSHCKTGKKFGVGHCSKNLLGGCAVHAGASCSIWNTEKQVVFFWISD